MRIGRGIGREGRKNFIPIKPNSSDASGIEKISNGSIFWSGDRYILREKSITEIKEVFKRHPEYTFKYKKE